MLNVFLGSRRGDYKLAEFYPHTSVLANGSLHIVPADKAVQGHYLCVADNHVGNELTKLVYINVHGKWKYTTNF